MWRRQLFSDSLFTTKAVMSIKIRHTTPWQLFGTDYSDQNGMLEEIPRSGTDSYRWLSHLGVCAPYATRRKRRYESNQVWLNTTFISQGSQSWGKLAVETWRVKSELIIITILHIIIITTSTLYLGFKTIAPKILAHTKCINKYWKYTQIFAATKLSKTHCKKSSKYWHLPKIFAHA
jgi:hypothetical protein